MDESKAFEAFQRIRSRLRLQVVLHEIGDGLRAEYQADDKPVPPGLSGLAEQLERGAA